MKRIVLVGALIGAAAGFAPAASAQEAHTWEYGGYLRLSWLDSVYNTTTGSGLGGRVGYFFADAWEAQLDASYSQNPGDTSKSVHTMPVHVRLLYNFPDDPMWNLFLGAGYTYNNNSGSVTGSSSGFGAVVGGRIHVQNNFWLMVDYNADWLNKPTSSTMNSGVEFGVMWLVGPPRPAAAPAPAPPPAAVAAPAAAVAVAAMPMDDDHDGVVNTADKCPMTPAGEPVDADGCSASQRDDDHDGVMNTADKCPNTPAGEPVDTNGCSASQRDTDGDGVMDDKDKCPNTPAGTKVDAVGCPVAPLVLEGVKFETNKAVLLAGSAATLDKVVTGLLANPTARIEIAGYTDNTSTADYNLKLSQQRADAVKAYIVSKGVAADRIEAKGYGQANPAVPNTTAANKAQNRRVELKILSY